MEDRIQSGRFTGRNSTDGLGLLAELRGRGRAKGST